MARVTPTPLPAEVSFPDASLTAQELVRYSRHIGLSEVGEAGQLRLKRASVLIVGAGGLGSPAALYLAAAGVGRIGIADFDTVDLTNLQRQLLHDTNSVGQRKTDSARARLGAVNPLVHVETINDELSAANALDIIAAYDVVIDGTDNFKTRYLTNDACVLLGKPNVYGSVLRFEGQASVFATSDGPCYRCLFPEPPPPGLVPSCAEAGVLGVLPGIVGTIQATEALKLILGVGDTLVGRLLLIDAMGMRFHTVRVPRDPNCPACGTREIQELIDYDEYCGTPGGEMAPSKDVPEITPTELAARLDAKEDFDLIDVREPYEWQLGRLPTARLIPLGQLPGALSTLDSTREIVVYCRSGKRSADATLQLRAAGFRAVNLAGGILRWSDEVDPSIPKY